MRKKIENKILNIGTIKEFLIKIKTYIPQPYISMIYYLY